MGARGPKPTAKSILQLRQSWRGKQGGVALEGDHKRTARPKWLVGDARKEWDRIAPKLFKEGLLTDLDRVPLALYCQAYADFLEAHRLTRSPLIKTTNGNVVQNPAVGLANNAWRRCLHLAGKFGMTPSDRNSVRAVEKPTTDDAKKRFFGGAG